MTYLHQIYSKVKQKTQEDNQSYNHDQACAPKFMSEKEMVEKK
jgi:hypothetical protein